MGPMMPRSPMPVLFFLCCILGGLVVVRFVRVVRVVRSVPVGIRVLHFRSAVSCVHE